MSDREYLTWLKKRLTNLDVDVKAPTSLVEKIRAGIDKSK